MITFFHVCAIHLQIMQNLGITSSHTEKKCFLYLYLFVGTRYISHIGPGTKIYTLVPPVGNDIHLAGLISLHI